MTDLKMPDPTGDFQKDFDLFVDAAVAAAEAKGYKRGLLEAAKELELWAVTGQHISELHAKWIARAEEKER